MFKNPFSWLSRSAGYWSDLRADTGTLFFPDRIQTQHSQTQLMSLLVTAGVSDVAQELQMPIGPQALEDVEEPMPSRLATLKDPGTSDQIALAKHSLTYFRSQPWCPWCVIFFLNDTL